VILLARVVQFASALLLAYGTSYGPRVSNRVFVFGAALTALMTIAIFSRERNWLRAIWPAVLGFAILFAVSGFPFLGRPVCDTDGLSGSGSSDRPSVACAGSGSQTITIAAIALVGAALVAAVVDWRRSSVAAA
jgi:hypothetical protein